MQHPDPSLKLTSSSLPLSVSAFHVGVRPCLQLTPANIIKKHFLPDVHASLKSSTCCVTNSNVHSSLNLVVLMS